MSQQQVVDLPRVGKSKYLTMKPEESVGGPLDKRIYLPDGLDWDLIRKNYRANCDLGEGVAQDEGLKSPTGRYKPRKGKYILEEEEDVEEQWKNKEYSREAIPEEKVKKIHQYTDIGVSQKQIAKDLGINVKTVIKYQEKREEDGDETRTQGHDTF